MSVIKAVRKSAGVSQVELAMLAKTFQSHISAAENGTVDPGLETTKSLLQKLGVRLIPVKTHYQSVSEDALEFARALKDNDVELAYLMFRQLSDNLGHCTPSEAAALTNVQPSSVGDPRFDALIAALVEYHLAKHQIPLPAWVDNEELRLEKLWAFNEFAKDLNREEKLTPAAFRKKNILMAESELQSI